MAAKNIIKLIASLSPVFNAPYTIGTLPDKKVSKNCPEPLSAFIAAESQIPNTDQKLPLSSHLILF